MYFLGLHCCGCKGGCRHQERRECAGRWRRQPVAGNSVGLRCGNADSRTGIVIGSRHGNSGLGNAPSTPVRPLIQQITSPLGVRHMGASGEARSLLPPSQVVSAGRLPQWGFYAERGCRCARLSFPAKYPHAVGHNGLSLQTFGPRRCVGSHLT